MNSLRSVRHALRGSLRAPLFTLVALLRSRSASARRRLCSASSTACCSKPLAYPEPDRLVAVWHDAPGRRAHGRRRRPADRRRRCSSRITDENRSFESIGIWAARHANVTGRAEPEEVPARSSAAACSTLSAFRRCSAGGSAPTTKLPARRGRDDLLRLLAAPLRRRPERRRPSASTVNSQPAEIVGVMPRGFRARRLSQPTHRAVALRSLAADAAAVLLQRHRAPEATASRSSTRTPTSRACCRSGSRLSVSSRSGGARRARSISTSGASRRRFGRSRTMSSAASATCCGSSWRRSAIVLRHRVRECHEPAARARRGTRSMSSPCARRSAPALGASHARCSWKARRSRCSAGPSGSRSRTARLQLLLALAPQHLPRLDEVALDARAARFSRGRHCSRPRAIFVPRQAFVRREHGWRCVCAVPAAQARAAQQHRAQNALVVGQVALALVLLVSSGLMIRTFEALRAVEPGFTAPEQIQTLRISVPPQLAPRCAGHMAAASGTSRTRWSAPRRGVGRFRERDADGTAPTNWDGIEVEGGRAIDDALRVFNNVSPGFLRTSACPSSRAATTSWTISTSSRPVVLVSENAGARALGRRPRQRSASGCARRAGRVARDHRRRRRTCARTVLTRAAAGDRLLADADGRRAHRRPFIVDRRVTFVGAQHPRRHRGVHAQIEQAVWSVDPNLPLAACARCRISTTIRWRARRSRL